MITQLATRSAGALSTNAYYGGDAADLGNVRRLPHKTFRHLVESVLDFPVMLNVTREQYALLDKKQRHAAKRVPYIVPCTYATPESQRLLERATGISLLCVDIDDSAMARPYFTSPAELDEQLKPFNYAVYTTASSTPQEPRLRILVEACIPVERYRDAINDIAYRIGLAEITRESYTANLPMYLPTIFKGDAEDTHPLLLSESGGRAYQLADIVNLQDPDLLATDKADPGQPTDIDALDYLRPTVDGVGILDVKTALSHLDPDMAYPEWLEVAASLRHQFPREPLGPQAYELFDEWSSRGAKYTSSEDTRAKWNSLKPSPRGRVPITVRTLFQRAALAGWNASPIKARFFAATRDWLRTAHPLATLMSDGLVRIAATPLLSQSEEEALLHEVVVQAREQHKMRTTVSSLRKDLRKLKSAASVEKKKKEVIPTWAKGICYISKINEFFRPSTVEYFSPEVLDRVYGSKLLASEQQLADKGGELMGMLSRPTVRPQDYLLNVIEVPIAYDTMYDPESPNDTFIHKEGKEYVNTYVRNYPEPDPDKADYAEMLFMEHLTNLVAEQEYRTTLLDFLAYIVQNPGAKIRWAVLLQGSQGCGKTFLAEAMRVVLGHGHVKPVDVDALGSGYNEWAYGSQLVTLEEVRVVGHNRHEVMNKLKPLISNDVVNINQKYRDTRSLQNKANYLLFSNHHDALALTAGDRRYFVVKSAIQTKAQVAALGDDYFQRMFTMLRDYGAGLRHFLENYAISPGFQAQGHAPITTYLGEVISDTAGDTSASLRLALEDSTNPLVQEDLISNGVLMQMLETGGDGGDCSFQHLVHVMRDEGYTFLGRYQLEDGAKHRLWVRLDSGLTKDTVKDEANRRLREGVLGEDDKNLL